MKFAAAREVVAMSYGLAAVSHLEFAARVFAALACGSLIGLERQ